MLIFCTYILSPKHLIMQDVSYESSGAAMTGAFLVLMVFYLAIVVLLIVSGWKVFEKAGKPGWASIIPIYSLVGGLNA